MPRVLVVEDDEHVARAVRTILERAGHDVVVATDGVAGIDRATAWTPDLVVLDLHLPDLPGVEVLRRVRSHLAAPVLVMSGDHDRRARQSALEAGAADHLFKPFDVADLLARVDALLSGATSAAATGASYPTATTVSVHDLGNTLAALMFGAHEAVERAAEGDRAGADEELARMQSLVQQAIADLRAARESGHRLG